MDFAWGLFACHAVRECRCGAGRWRAFRGGGGFPEFSRFEPAEASAMGRMMCVRAHVLRLRVRACCRAAERAGSLAAQAGGRRVLAAACRDIREAG